MVVTWGEDNRKNYKEYVGKKCNATVIKKAQKEKSLRRG